MKQVGIYYIKHKSKPGFAYIGSSTNFESRRAHHFSDLRLGKHPNVKLQNIYNKYGVEGLYFEFTEYVGCENIRDVEKQKIDEFVSLFGRDLLINISLDTYCPFDDPEVRARVNESIRKNELDEDFVRRRNKRATDTITTLNASPAFREAAAKRLTDLNKCEEFVAAKHRASSLARSTEEYKIAQANRNRVQLNSLWQQPWFRDKVSRAAAKTGANKEIRKHYLEKVRKSVICHDLNLTFPSLYDAAKFIVGEGKAKSTNSVEGGVRMVCNGKQSKAYGFRWSWLDKKE